MQPYPKATPSTHLFDTPTPICAHTYLQQSTLPALPTLYITSRFRGPIASNIPLSTLSYLQQSLTFLGSMEPRSLPRGRDVQALRRELERGMSRDRREQMLCFVMGLRDERQRRAAEVYLAKYAGFVLDWEGKLDFGVGDRFVVGEKEEAEKGEGKGWCVVM